MSTAAIKPKPIYIGMDIGREGSCAVAGIVREDGVFEVISVRNLRPTVVTLRPDEYREVRTP